MRHSAVHGQCCRRFGRTGFQLDPNADDLCQHSNSGLWPCGTHDLVLPSEILDSPSLYRHIPPVPPGTKWPSCKPRLHFPIRRLLRPGGLLWGYRTRLHAAQQTPLYNVAIRGMLIREPLVGNSRCGRLSTYKSNQDYLCAVPLPERSFPEVYSATFCPFVL
jgi:hypothetical protein